MSIADVVHKLVDVAAGRHPVLSAADADALHEAIDAAGQDTVRRAEVNTAPPKGEAGYAPEPGDGNGAADGSEPQGV